MSKSTHLDLIPFVRAKPENSESQKKPEKRKQGLDGSKVKLFYESLISDTNISKSASEETKEVSSRRKSKRSPKPTNKQNVPVISANGFLKAAQDGDLDTIKTGLNQGIDIDVVDNYGWSALMCSSHTGHKDVVKYLLQNGADKTVQNKWGQSVFYIAKLRERQDIISLLESTSNEDLNDPEPSTSQVHYETFHCDICGTDVENTTLTQHNASTVHLFNSNIKPQPPSYMIPESNKGFQLMLKTGWDKEQGLGSQGQGQKYPVKTILKRDRLGLGSDTKNKKAKVTHFAPRDTKAVKRSKEQTNDRFLRSATIGKRQKSKIEAKQKEKEKKFRREFY